MRPLELFLSRLEKVSKSGKGFKACCPAHSDNNPSLCIDEKEGVVVFHCWAGCEPESIVLAVNLTFSDLYVDKKNWREKTKIDLGFEYGVLALIKNDKRRGIEINQFDLNRANLAIHRIETCKQLGIAK